MTGRRPRYLAPLLLALIVVCTFVVGETVARRQRPDLGYAALRAHVEAQRYNWSTPDADFHHVGDGRYGFTIPSDPAGNTRRILVVGDSFAMGHGVEADERFATVAAGLLGGRFDVQVMATSGYSPIVYRNIVRRALDAARYESVAVFVDQTDPADDVLYRNDLVQADSRTFDVALMNDRRDQVDEVSDRMLADLSGLTGILRHSVLRNMIGDFSLAARFPEESVHYRYVQASRSAPRLVHAFQAEPGSQVATAMERLLLVHLDEIVELCSSRGVRLILAANPWEFQVSPSPRVDGGHPDPYPRKNRLAEVLSRHYEGSSFVELLDLTAEMRAAPEPSALFLDEPANEIHWSAAGHRRVGEALARRLAGSAKPSRQLALGTLDFGQAAKLLLSAALPRGREV